MGSLGSVNGVQFGKCTNKVTVNVQTKLAGFSSPPCTWNFKYMQW